MNKRDEFSEETRRILRERVGGLCSRPECDRTTVSPNETDHRRVDITGRAAHITAAQKGGPRYDEKLTSEQRRGVGNGIWLCADCADLVDKNEGEGFTVEQLNSWKRFAENRQLSLARLRDKWRQPALLETVSTPHYANIPRLLHLSQRFGLSKSTRSALKNGFPQDRSIIEELIEVGLVLRHLNIKAVDVRDITDPTQQLMEGMAISFHQKCRTKGGASENPEDVKNYSFDRSPLVYVDSSDYRYIFPYDPIWVTTGTAHGTMRYGNVKLAGLGLIKIIDHDNKQVIATPLVLGLPNIG